MDGAACAGYLEVVKFLHETRREGCTIDAMDSAARRGHLEVWGTTVYLLISCCTRNALLYKVPVYYHIDKAIYFLERRRCLLLQIVKFLHEHRPEGCTTAAFDSAAWGGHIGVLKFLKTNRDEGCTAYAMVLAAWHGHLDVVKWLHSNQDEVKHIFGLCVFFCGVSLLEPLYVIIVHAHINSEGSAITC